MPCRGGITTGSGLLQHGHQHGRFLIGIIGASVVNLDMTWLEWAEQTGYRIEMDLSGISALSAN